MIHSNKPQLSFEVGANHLHGVLRVDQIRADTLVQLVQHWNSDPKSRDEVIAALDGLADVVSSVRREGELDAALEDVEEAAAMETAQVEVDRWDVHRLVAEAAEVGRLISRGRGAAEIRHPSMLPTRRHFAEHPLPSQRSEGDAA